MQDIFKPYLPGTIEEYPYQVNYIVNGAMFYMNIYAENEEEAVKKAKQIYFKDEEIEVIRIISK